MPAERPVDWLAVQTVTDRVWHEVKISGERWQDILDWLDIDDELYPAVWILFWAQEKQLKTAKGNRPESLEVARKVAHCVQDIVARGDGDD